MTLLRMYQTMWSHQRAVMKKTKKSHLMESTMSKNKILKIMNRDIMILVSVGTQEVPREQRTCTRTVVPFAPSDIDYKYA